MLLLFTCPADSAPITVSPTGRRRISAEMSTETAMIAAAVIIDTGSRAENSVATSAVASTVNSRNGDSTKKVRRLRTCRACGPSRSMRAMT